MIVNLNAGSPNPAQRCFKVNIHTDTWRPEDRQLFRWFENVYDVFANNYKAGETAAATFYFIGEQDRRDPMLFHVHDQRKLALIYPWAEQNRVDDFDDIEERTAEAVMPGVTPQTYTGTSTSAT